MGWPLKYSTHLNNYKKCEARHFQHPHSFTSTKTRAWEVWKPPLAKHSISFKLKPVGYIQGLPLSEALVSFSRALKQLF